MKTQSSDFVKAGTHIMEPYRRLLERRWDNMQIKVRELEYALKSRKEERDFQEKQQAPRPVADYVTSSKTVTVESAPVEYDDFWWKDEQEVKKTPGTGGSL